MENQNNRNFLFTSFLSADYQDKAMNKQHHCILTAPLRGGMNIKQLCR